MARSKVLYIDDDPGIGRLVQKTLVGQGFDVELAYTGNDGINKILEKTFDVVVLDHHMPGQTGIVTLRQIRSLPEPPPVVYVTGSEDSHVAVAALKSGAVDYVWKDVQGHFRELLSKAIGTALEQERNRREKAAADQEIRLAKDRAELLLKEVNHRVANSLAIVAGLVGLQKNMVADPTARALFEQMRARIIAVAAVHRRLYTSHDVRSVELCEYIGGLLQELKDAMDGEGRRHQIRVHCDRLFLPTDKAVSLGILVTELVTNAYKYAYPGSQDGEIRVSIVADEGGAILSIEDDGVGVHNGAVPSGTGLGSRVIALMSSSLGGPIVFPEVERGTKATLTFKI